MECSYIKQCGVRQFTMLHIHFCSHQLQVGVFAQGQLGVVSHKYNLWVLVSYRSTSLKIPHLMVTQNCWLQSNAVVSNLIQWFASLCLKMTSNGKQRHKTTIRIRTRRTDVQTRCQELFHCEINTRPFFEMVLKSALASSFANSH